MKYSMLFVISAFWFSASTQNIEVNGSIMGMGLVNSEEKNPFWFFTNSNASITPETSFGIVPAIETQYDFHSASLKAGVAFYYRDGIEDELQRRDLYIQFENDWLLATLGSKRLTEPIYGLSATNKNFLWSGNARPLPGLRLEANNPIQISESFALDWGIGHYNLNDERYVADVRVHYKRLGIVLALNENNQFTGRIQHFAQWGGTSPDFGDLPSDFNAFIDVFFARKASESTVDGEVRNALGNHLGSYFLEYALKTTVGDFTTYHEHPFEDGSGTRFANFPDGVWGLHFSPENRYWITNIVYEYIDTSDQSGDTSDTSGADGYFGNNLYRSGWTYEDRVIGLPFVLLDPEVPLNMMSSKFNSNRSRVHHLGISGTVSNVEWQVKSTYASYLGTYRNPFEPTINRWLNYVSSTYTTKQIGNFTILLGLDSGSGATVVGGGVKYRYIF